MERSFLQTGLGARGAFRWVAVDSAFVLEEARRRLDLSPVAAVALGRLLTGAVLLSRLSFKVPARLILEARGDGPAGTVRAEVEGGGALRGTIGNPLLETPEADKIRIADAIGKGFLHVTREREGKRYTSRVALTTSEIGDDLAHYLEQSRQIRSAVLLGVLPKPLGIGAAGGLVVEALPGTPDEDVSGLEANLAALEGVSRILEAKGVSGLVASVFRDFDVELLERQELEYRCRCRRERFLDALALLPQEDRDHLVEDGTEIETTCSFCGARYEFRVEELGVGT